MRSVTSAKLLILYVFCSSVSFSGAEAQDKIAVTVTPPTAAGAPEELELPEPNFITYNDNDCEVAYESQSYDWTQTSQYPELSQAFPALQTAIIELILICQVKADVPKVCPKNKVAGEKEIACVCAEAEKEPACKTRLRNLATANLHKSKHSCPHTEGECVFEKVAPGTCTLSFTRVQTAVFKNDKQEWCASAEYRCDYTCQKNPAKDDAQEEILLKDEEAAVLVN